jgi:hypothetical protein
MPLRAFVGCIDADPDDGLAHEGAAAIEPLRHTARQLVAVVAIHGRVFEIEPVAAVLVEVRIEDREVLLGASLDVIGVGRRIEAVAVVPVERAVLDS